MGKLISMVVFVKKQNETAFNSMNFMVNTIRYAKFLSQPLELGMFIPCDEDGNILEEPEKFKDWLEDDVNNGHYPVGISCEKYQQAKDRVIFEGAKLITEKGVYLNKPYVDEQVEINYTYTSVKSISNSNIEELLNLEKEQTGEGLDLTQSKAKELGL